MGIEQRKALIEQIEKKRGSKLICCLTSDRINANGLLAKDFIPIFFQHLRKFPATERVDTFMFTMGGETLAAFGLSRLLREFAKHLGVLVPEKCHSGGTLFCLGADEICMTKIATLSPIDPSITGLMNPMIELAPGQRQFLPVSVESVAGYKTLVKDDWKLNEGDTGLAFKMLAERINPLLLGDVYRSREQITRLAEKLLHNHRRDKKQITHISEQLTKKLGSHDYLISRKEAREIFGRQILADDEDLEKLIWELYEDFESEMELGKPYNSPIVLNNAKAQNTPMPVRVQQKIVTIESSSGKDVWERHINIFPLQLPTPGGMMDRIRSEPIQEGWTHSND